MHVRSQIHVAAPFNRYMHVYHSLSIVHAYRRIFSSEIYYLSVALINNILDYQSPIKQYLQMFKFLFPSFQTDNKLDLLVENLGRVNFVKFERKSTFDDQYKGTFFFSSPELKAQVSFSDHLSSGVCLSVRPSVRPSVCLSVCL